MDWGIVESVLRCQPGSPVQAGFALIGAAAGLVTIAAGGYRLWRGCIRVQILLQRGVLQKPCETKVDAAPMQVITIARSAFTLQLLASIRTEHRPTTSEASHTSNGVGSLTQLTTGAARCKSSQSIVKRAVPLKDTTSIGIPLAATHQVVNRAARPSLSVDGDWGRDRCRTP